MRRLLGLFLLAACKREAPVTIEDAAPPVASSVASEAPIAFAGVPKPSMALESKRLLERWDAAYNAHDANAIANNYMPEVRFYGHTLSRDACREKIASTIAKSPDQTQSSAVDEVVVVPDGVRVKVTKTVANGGKTSANKLSFHLVKSQSGGLRIEEETDH